MDVVLLPLLEALVVEDVSEEESSGISSSMAAFGVGCGG
jgi:hypothetical protein